MVGVVIGAGVRANLGIDPSLTVSGSTAVSACLTLDEVRRAAAALADHAVRTPLVSSPKLDELVGAQVLAKNEAAQRTGSFKFRGAFHRVTLIPGSERAAGVVAVSSGNHGAAVAEAARLHEIPAHIFVPIDAPKSKRRLIEEAGAHIHEFERARPDREGPARALAAELGATFVHPFEDRAVMAGQGTTALELVDQITRSGHGPLDALVVPMGGGGLMAGCGSVIQAVWPTCRLIGVEPEAADDTRRSLAAGQPVSIDQPVTVADGLAVTSPGEATFAINRQLVHQVQTVTEDEILSAVELVARALGIVVEPSGAVAVAAIVGGAVGELGPQSARVGAILTGGNTDHRPPIITS